MVIYQKAVDIYHNGCDFICPKFSGIVLVWVLPFDYNDCTLALVTRKVKLVNLFDLTAE